MTPDAHMVETLRLRTAALRRVAISNDLLRRENDDLRARIAAVEEVWNKLDNDAVDSRMADDEAHWHFAHGLENARDEIRAALDGTP